MNNVDVLVVGSGFGGSVAALRATEKGYRVAVLEAGRRFEPEELARSSWDVRRFLWIPRLGCRGIQRLTLLRHALVLSGAGVGGGSLVYANTLYEPLEAFFRDPQWAGITDWREELAPYYELARRMLGATPVPFETPADAVMRRVAARMGVSDTYHQPDVGVYFGEPGAEVADPYFGGAGPVRRGCIRCGGCMVGCRYHAKNTLDRNYLWLAERAGARIFPEHEATSLRRLDDGRWEVETRRPGAWRRRTTVFRADQVVLAAGVLGTLKLLFGSGLGGPRLGELVRTNSEAIVGAGATSRAVDYSRGIAITSSFHPDPETRIEPVRYPAGSNLMGLLGLPLVDGGGRVPRPVRLLAAIARRPLTFLRSLVVRGWSERTIILLVMQAHDNALRLTWSRGKLRSRTTDRPIPAYIPAANEAARIAAEEIGGVPGSSLNEVLLGRPTTAHILGGAVIGATADDGVIDPYHRVYGEPGLHVVDGTAVSANLGVNPSLTIAAQAERSLALWPNRGEPDGRPTLGEGYERIEPVPARFPAFGNASTIAPPAAAEAR